MALGRWRNAAPEKSCKSAWYDCMISAACRKRIEMPRKLTRRAPRKPSPRRRRGVLTKRCVQYAKKTIAMNGGRASAVMKARSLASLGPLERLMRSCFTRLCIEREYVTINASDRACRSAWSQDQDEVDYHSHTGFESIVFSGPGIVRARARWATAHGGTDAGGTEPTQPAHILASRIYGSTNALHQVMNMLCCRRRVSCRRANVVRYIPCIGMPM